MLALRAAIQAAHDVADRRGALGPWATWAARWLAGESEAHGYPYASQAREYAAGALEGYGYALEIARGSDRAARELEALAELAVRVTDAVVCEALGVDTTVARARTERALARLRQHAPDEEAS